MSGQTAQVLNQRIGSGIKPLRVLQVVDTLGMGGAETWLVELQKYWSKTKRVQMDFLLTSGNKGIFDDEVAEKGANLFYCPFRKSRLLNFTNEFRGILKRGRYDAIHDHQDYASGWHFLAGLGRLPKVVIAHVHNPAIHITVNYNVSKSRRLTAYVGHRLVERLGNRVCGTSAAILNEYGFVPGRERKPKVQVAHCGFNVARFNESDQTERDSVRSEFNWPANSKLVLFAGRLDRALQFDHPQNHKNSWFALHVMKVLAQKHDNVCMIMAGGGQESKTQLEDAINSWGLSDRLRLVGIRHDVPRLMRAADALLFPSRQEGLGMVAVEAQAAGLPVLASTAVPRECVVIGEMCEFMSLDEPIEAWAETLWKTLQKPRPNLQQCRTAVQASAFSIENSAATLESIYSSASPAQL